MGEKTVGDHLLDALDDLEEEQLKRFKAKLTEIPLREGFAHIPRGRLQKADVLDLSHLLLSFYTDAYAPQVAARVLDSISLKLQAQRLRSATGIGENGSGQTTVQSSGRYGPQEPISGEPHFIDRHRAELIQRTSTVEAVLDQIHGSILNDEQYDIIVSQKTNPEKMRKLYELMRSWDRSCKDQLYEALKSKNRFLVQDLERS